MQRLEQMKARLGALVEVKSPGARTPKQKDWEKHVRALQESDEGARIDTFFEILIRRLDLPMAGMQTEDYAEWVKEHREALAFLYREPPLPEKCGPVGSLTREIRRLGSELLKLPVLLPPPDVAEHLRSEIEAVPPEIATLRSARNWLKGWFYAYLYISIGFFTLLAVWAADLLGLIHFNQPSGPEFASVSGATVVQALAAAVGGFGTLSVTVVLGQRWKRKEAEFQASQHELQEAKQRLGQEVSRLQAEASESYRLAASKASNTREQILDDLADAVGRWRSAVCNEMVKDFFEQGVWINDRLADRLKALLTEIQRPYPPTCRVDVKMLRDDQIESAYRVLTAVVASMIAARVDLGVTSTLARLLISGAEPGLNIPSPDALLERLENEGVLLKGEQLSDDTKLCMTEVLAALRS
jgi:hypothetical protein